MNSKTLLTIILMFVVFGAGFLVGRMTAMPGAVFTGSSSDPAGMSGQLNDGQNTSSTEGATKIDSSNMTEGQRKLISSLGLNPDNITVTAEMVACAEAKLGAARVEEIKNGATPSFTEGASLVVCYK